MNLGTGNRRQTITALVLGVLALGACFYIYEELFATAGSNAGPSPAAPVATAPARTASAPDGQHAARPVVTTGTLDPTLHMQAMLVSEAVTYSGAGRNIFSAQSAPPPVPIPQPIAPARLAPPIPCPPNCPPPPPPPPIDLKFFGIETAANGARQACLLHNDAVYLASAGDVVMRRYKVLSIEPKSIQVQDLQNNNTQTLPLLTN
jgi:hypothetical protein